MRIKTLSEVIWKFYQNGTPKSDKQNLSEADILQMCKMGAANNFRQQYLFGQKVIPGKRILALPDEPEYYFVSPLLSIKRFKLSEPDAAGLRRVDMEDFDLYRMPKNAHFTNIYPVNSKCGGQDTGEATMIKNGEERFYSKPKFKGFLFYTVTGRGLNTVNFPPCIEKVDVETTYDSPEIDISLDVAYDVSTEVLSVVFKIEDATGEMQIKIREELKQKEDIK